MKLWQLQRVVYEKSLFEEHSFYHTGSKQLVVVVVLI